MLNYKTLRKIKNKICLVKCDKIRICKDPAVEAGCSCAENEFTCQCYKQNPLSCAFHSACVLLEQYGDGRRNCSDGSDETPFLSNVQCGDCDVTLRRLNNISECNKIGFPSCDVLTCYETPSLDCDGTCNKSDVICTSRCSINSSACHRPFQCSDGSLILAFQFCDGIVDCPDNSDEIINQPGFVCEKDNWRKRSYRNCVLPQINLYDDIAQCENGRDLCDGDKCFKCFDKQLMISFVQICDGIVDCYDLSDECLCYNIITYDWYDLGRYCNAIFTIGEKSSVVTTCDFNSLSYEKLDQDFFKNNPGLASYYGIDNFDVSPILFLNKRKITRPPYCHSTNSVLDPTLCDGRPECSDFSDECNDYCRDQVFWNLPNFCNDPCRSHFPMGDRYCDGVEDPAWVHINNSACPQGFDEQDCPNRFKCKADGKMSIHYAQKCDGTIDCDDGSDETFCTFTFFDVIIQAKFDRFVYAFWVIGCVVIFGNLFAIVFTVKLLRSKLLSDSIWTQYLIILNISIADFIMGVYLLIIARYGFAKSGYTLSGYEKWRSADYEWRSSLGCSVIGSLSVISSEASCFLMVVLTAFRLRNISNPIASLSVSTLKWKICICFAWFLAVVLAVVPIQNFDYFVNYILFGYYNGHRDFSQWTTSNLQSFACRYAIITNQSMDNLNDPWQSTKSFFQTNSLNPPLVFGYYGGTSVCLPNYFMAWFGHAWQYTLAIISVNFMSFIFIAVSYVIMYYLSKKYKKKINKNNKRSSKQEATMRKRIARIIATDFLCWIPICSFSYLTMTSGNFLVTDGFYQIIAVVFLPINSALNPFLYSSLPDIIIKKICYCCRKKNTLTNVGAGN